MNERIVKCFIRRARSIRRRVRDRSRRTLRLGKKSPSSHPAAEAVCAECSQQLDVLQWNQQASPPCVGVGVPPPPSPVIKKRKKSCLTLSCCFSGTYHLCSPLGYWYKSKCRRRFRMNQQFWGGGGLIEFYLDFIKHLDKPIKEVADCRHQHLIHHAVVGVKSDWH